MPVFCRPGFAVLLIQLSFALGHSAVAADIDLPKEAAATAAGFRQLVPDDRTAEPRLAPASNEGEIRLKQFRHVPGLQINLWAAEPMLANPVAFSVDEGGRVFTSETYRYRTSVLDIRHYMFMLEDDLASRNITNRLENIRKWFGPAGEAALSRETEVIRLLEDTDHDGRADRSTVFADGFNSPLDGIASGVLARHGDVWITDIPSVWKMSPRPAGQDAAPEPRTPLASRPTVHSDGYQAEELFRGFGVRFSFTGHDLHGLKFGPDGRLYFSCGDRGTHLVTREGKLIDLPDEGAVFRCEPDGSHLEVVHRGLRNPQELAFNEWGELFTGDNDSDQGDRERWVQVIEGADSGWRVGYQHAPLGNAGPWNMERLWVPFFEGQAAYLLPPIANIGDGPSGLVYDYGTSLPAALAHRFLLAYFKGTSARSGIYSLRNRPAGAGYELVAHDEFVWNSLVPDVDLGPDGSIFFADWHEGWPKSNKGRLYRAWFPEVVADPVVKETAKLLREGMAKRNESELVALLSHRDMRVRQEAQFELAARGAKSFTALKGVAFESKNVLARLHALWGVGQISRYLTDSDLSWNQGLYSLVPLLKDQEPEVRAHAARLFGDLGMVDTKKALAGMLSDPASRVRLAALQGLSKLAASGEGKGIYTRLDAGLVDRIGVNVAGRGLPHPQYDPTPEITALLSAQPRPEPLLLQAAARTLAEIVDVPLARVMNPISAGFRLTGLPHSNAVPVRLAAILGLRQLADTNILRFLSDPDPLLVLESARAINDVPINDALPALATLAEPAKLESLLKQFAALEVPTSAGAVPTGGAENAIRDVRADQPLPWGNAPIDQLSPMLLRVVNANFRVGSPETAQRLASLTTRAELSDLIRSEAIHTLATWARPHPRDRIVGVYRPLPPRDPAPAREALQPRLTELLMHSSETVRVAAAEAVAELRLTGAAEPLFQLVTDTRAPALARATALRALVTIAEDRASTTMRDEAMTFAAADAAEPLRLAASKLNAELNPGNAAGQLAAKLASGSVAEQQSAYASLGDLKSDAADALLAEALDQLMKREIANEVMLDLVEAAAKRDASAVKTRLAAYQDWKLPKDHLSPYREALFGGDAARGKKIFYENAAVACTRCHQIGSDGGGNAGPKLDGLATRTTREHLLESIVFPNQQVLEGFETAIITLKNGQSYAGIVKSENGDGLIVIAPEEGEITLNKADIASRDKGVSGMPEGFGQLLTRQELRDVVEFLGTLK